MITTYHRKLKNISTKMCVFFSVDVSDLNEMNEETSQR